MPLFFHDRVLHGDEIGFGLWRIEHYLEHLQFCGIGNKTTPAVKIPDYDVGVWDWDDALVKQWLDSHENIHSALRLFTNVSGVDLSLTDLKDATSWYEWHDAHANEHVLIRTNLGVT